ncbi:Ger(x)C family spore germination protein [Paenibacillus prosopidis]|uniref:Spore germination protein KC n=1 Tax=Paenibacillus prosopidis TaxID=630520 RepID=A0A368W5J7_9BACL|nr:Ger(x)C family spore germination protein [Paenibacillus prosopidis]RCW51033.1 spore germination protein KC [Paenibacillus prosopidis]
MARKLFVFISCLLLLFPLTGCWNRRELNELGISVGIGIDKAEKGYRVSVQVVNPGEVTAGKTSGNRTPITLYEATGDTIFEAIRKITTISPRVIYLAHLRVLVIGESLAREGIEKPLDHFSRDHEVRTDFFIVIAKGSTAKDVLKVLTPIEKIPANKLYLSLETSQKVWAPTATVTLDELMTDIISEGKSPVLSAVKVTGGVEGQSQKNVEKIDPSGRLKYTGLAVFREDKLIGWLNEKESKGYSYIRDKVRNTVGTLVCPEGGKIGVEVTRSKTQVTGKMNNGKPQINIEIRMEENIGEVECQIDLTKRKTIEDLEKSAEQKVAAIMLGTIHKVQKSFKVDIFGFGEEIHRVDPTAWKTLKQNWDEQFTHLDINVKADVQIRRIGTVSNSFHKKEEE